jgi:hypothetical protein
MKKAVSRRIRMNLTPIGKRGARYILGDLE